MTSKYTDFERCLFLDFGMNSLVDIFLFLNINEITKAVRLETRKAIMITVIDLLKRDKKSKVEINSVTRIILSLTCGAITSFKLNKKFVFNKVRETKGKTIAALIIK